MAKDKTEGQSAGSGGKKGLTVAFVVALALAGLFLVSLLLCYSRRIPPPPPRVVRFLKPRTSPPPVRVEEKVNEMWRIVDPMDVPPFTGWYIVAPDASDVRVAISLGGSPGFDDPEDVKLVEQEVPQPWFEYVIGLASPGQEPVLHAVGEWVYAKDEYDLDWVRIRHDVTLK